MATHSSILAWRIPQTEDPGGATVHGGHKRIDWATKPYSVVWKGHTAFIHFIRWGTLEWLSSFSKRLLCIWLYKCYSPCCPFFGGINQGLTFLGRVITLFHFLGECNTVLNLRFFFFFLNFLFCMVVYIYMHMWASLVAQLVKNPLAMQETWVRSLGGEDPLQKV